MGVVDERVSVEDEKKEKKFCLVYQALSEI